MSETPYTYKDGLRSERLTTRFLTTEDAPAWSDFFKTPEAIELFPPSFFVPGQDDAATWISRQQKRYKDNNYGLQALIDTGTGEFIGQCGLLRQEVDGRSETEVGYHVFKKHWGKGYAPEAAKMFLRHAFENNLAPSVVSIIDTRNTKSQRVAEKNGLSKEKETTWNGLRVFIYRIHRHDWNT